MWSYILVAIESGLLAGMLYLFLSAKELYRQHQAPLSQEELDLEPLREGLSALVYQLEKTASEIEASMLERCQELRALVRRAREEGQELERLLRQDRASLRGANSAPVVDIPPGKGVDPNQSSLGEAEPYSVIPLLYQQGLKKGEIARDLHLGREEGELALELMGDTFPSDLDTQSSQKG